MARAKKPRIVDLKREYTFEMMQQSNKSFWIIDPDLLESGEQWIDNPPTKGYLEQYVLDHGKQTYVQLNMTINDFKQAIADRTVNKASVVNKMIIESDYLCIVNNRHKLLDEDDANKAIMVENWTGKIYSRVYSFAMDGEKDSRSYYIIEGCRSNRGCQSFIIVPLKMFDDLKIL